MYAAILAGGVGTRLWPRSRRSQPKQFADITGSGRTMIQATADRLQGLVSPQDLYVITGHDYAHLTRAQLPEMPEDQVILEPSGRNTAPAIGLACIVLRRRDPAAIIAILPADHVIADGAAFRQALTRAGDAAAAGHIVTLGITPTSPHTGYGYIRHGARLTDLPDGTLPVYRVARFLEKPDAATAADLVAAGDTYWNGGIFVSRVDVMLAEIQRQLPALAEVLETYAADLDQAPQDAEARLSANWTNVPSISIDHGVMEGATSVATVPLSAGWNDVGSWDALATILAPDDHANVVARGTLQSHHSHGNIIFCDDVAGSPKLVALIGVDDLVVVDTGDTLLVGRKEQMQQVKDVVERLRSQGRLEIL
jgi:mannose-1-phosphate guanylyltransferase